MKRRITAIIVSVAVCVLGFAAVVYGTGKSDSASSEEASSSGQDAGRNDVGHDASTFLDDDDDNLAEDYPPTDDQDRASTTYYPKNHGYYPTPMLMMALWDCQPNQSDFEVTPDYGWVDRTVGSMRPYLATFAWDDSNRDVAERVLTCVVSEIGLSDSLPSVVDMMAWDGSQQVAGDNAGHIYQDDDFTVSYGNGSDVVIEELVTPVAFGN